MTMHIAPAMPSAAELGQRAFAMLAALNRFTDEPGKLTRLYLSPAHRQGVDYVLAHMRSIGLQAHMDALGSAQGRMEGRSPGLPAIMIGSHIDTVKDAGAYDGNLGVVAGLLVAEALRPLMPKMPFALEVVAFGDEENVRFPTNLSTSAALSSGYDPSWLEARDAAGVSVREALIGFGGDPDGAMALKRTAESVAGYIELHIEQGPVLEVNDEAVGIVTAINGQIRARVRVTGEAGHAGTVPMALRKDALAAAAEMVLALETIAASHPEANGTVGVLTAEPGATNVVPGTVAFTIDFRAPLDATVAAMHESVQVRFAEIAARRGVGLSIEPYARLSATPMNAALQTALERGIARTGANLKARRIPSGAGHDAMIMARNFPAAMLFVRNEKGISHSPLENMTEEDAGIAVKVMLETVLALAAEPQSGTT
jgi:allantoate deiminase